MNFIADYQPYASNRYPIFARNGMVCSSCPQASAAGIEAMKRGGNAVDAAVATASALTVCEPTANGIGADAFSLIWVEKEKRLYGLNASGFSPKKLTFEMVRERSQGDKMPMYGWLPTMVPGAPAAWAAVAARFGKLPLRESMAPAIGYAKDGYPVAPIIARMWKNSFDTYQALGGEEYREWFRTFAPSGRPPAAGELVKLPNHGNTLEEIAETNGESFYRGALAEKIVADSEKNGGYFCKEDFSEYQVEWVEPIRTNYRGYDICEIPPNGQGIVALMALNVLKEFSFPEKESVETYHKQWEAMKIAFADGKHYVTDSREMKIPYQDFLAPEYGALRAKEIGEMAGAPGPKVPQKGGTVYFCTADGEGNMVSFIQSNFWDFGSGIVVSDTGIALQNRGFGFSLNPEDANVYAPGKRTYHTIIPGFIMKDGEAVAPFGVMGGHMQPQGHVQVATNLIDFHLNPQQALDAPRWMWSEGKKFLVEDRFSPEMAKQLIYRGHQVEISLDNDPFGKGQIIVKQPDGTLVGGTESRADSNIACY